jgi:beta-glucosidase-like glycosyl hydrolase
VAPLDLPILVPAIRLDRDATAEEAKALRRAREPWVAGFCLFGGEAEGVTALTARLRDAAGRPLFVASDVERGAGQQVRGLTVLPDAGVFGLAATPAEVEAFGEITAREARTVGVDVLFAPVLDVRSEPGNPIVGNRAYGWDPQRVALLGAAFVRGALRGGAAPVAKHFPGHGATATDSHDAVPVVREGARRLLARDVEPFLHAVRDARCPAVMTAHVAYPALDPSGRVATYSAPILDLLRRALPDPDDVAILTDALLMDGAQEGSGEVGAARAALEAGCDLLLYPEDAEGVAARVLAEGGARLRALAERAAGRARGLLGRIVIAAAEASTGALDPVTVPLEVARRAVRLAGAETLGREKDWLLVLDDDDVSSRGRVLAEAGRRARVPVGVVRVPRGERPPADAPVAGGWTAVVMASVRAWKGASGVSPATAEVVATLREAAERSGGRLRLVWCAPHAPAGEVHVPGTGPQVEAALAEVLFGARAAKAALRAS